MISLEKLKILAHTKKLPKTVGDLGKLIVPKGFKKLPKGQKIAISGHTDGNAQRTIQFVQTCNDLPPKYFLFML